MAEFRAEWGMLAYAAAGSATRLIDPWILILSVWGGSFAGDQLWFALGRRYGPRAAARPGRGAPPRLGRDAP